MSDKAPYYIILTVHNDRSVYVTYNSYDDGELDREYFKTWEEFLASHAGRVCNQKCWSVRVK